MPRFWHRLWEMLPEKRQLGIAWEPPVPLILAAWHHSSNDAKRARFLMHLTWAEERGALKPVVDFLETLNPDDWHTTR